MLYWNQKEKNFKKSLKKIFQIKNKCRVFLVVLQVLNLGMSEIADKALYLVHF